MTVHLEGMGVVGCMAAWHLHAAGRPFTWSDADAPIAAWRASTGCAYPSGDALSEACRAEWIRWVHDGAPWSSELPCVAVESRYWYASIHPPHKGTDRPTRTVAGFTSGEASAVHLNAQRFVLASRDRFARQRRDNAPPGAYPLVVAHGFGSAPVGYLWGWSARARLSVAPAAGAGPHTFYARRGRILMSYAYPVPGEAGWWYAGSAMVRQRTPRPLSTDQRVAAWRAHIEEIGGDLVRVVEVGPVVHGWRPLPHPCTEHGRFWHPTADGFRVVPLAHSGVRLAPEVARQIMTALAASV